MTGSHRALIIEDDRPTANDLLEILRSLGFDSTVVDNKLEALRVLKSGPFCLILLDLQIKLEPDSVKGHAEHGASLLRDIRRIYWDHTGVCYWLPVIVLSGFVSDRDIMRKIMKDGANDVLHKPPGSGAVSEMVRATMECSGRLAHEQCLAGMLSRPRDTETTVEISVMGDRERRRTRIMVGAKSVWVPDGALRVLLHLMIAREENRPVHKNDLGARSDKGFKEVSRLRNELKPALSDGDKFISNDYQGNYRLAEDVTITMCAAERLDAIGDKQISALSRRLERLIARRLGKV